MNHVYATRSLIYILTDWLTDWLGFNAEGMHVYTLKRKLLVSFPYADIYRWGGSSSQFSLIMADANMPESFEFVIITGQAADMAAIILDHIRQIMAEQEAAEGEA